MLPNFLRAGDDPAPPALSVEAGELWGLQFVFLVCAQYSSFLGGNAAVFALLSLVIYGVYTAWIQVAVRELSRGRMRSYVWLPPNAWVQISGAGTVHNLDD